MSALKPFQPSEVAAARRAKPSPDRNCQAGMAASDSDAAEPQAPLATEPAAYDAHTQHLRILEAALFASAEPLDARTLARTLPVTADVPALLQELQAAYAGRGVTLQRIAGKWAFRTAADLAAHLRERREEPKRLSRAGLETLAIIAYHQPVTRAEIEDIRGVAVSTGTLDMLLEIGWVRWRGRRRAPGRPLTYGTSDAFLEHFGLASLADLPRLADLKGAGLLDSAIPAGFKVPDPELLSGLLPDELPLEAAAEEEGEDESERVDRSAPEAE